MTLEYTPSVPENLQPFTSPGTNIYTTARRGDLGNGGTEEAGS